MPTGATDYVGVIAAYRRDFRTYLQGLNWADEWRSASFDSTEDSLAFDAEVLGRLYQAGWSRYGWPTRVGGLGGNEIHRAAYYEELAYAMLPIPAQHYTLEVLGPAVLKFAPELAAQYLPRCLAGLEWWGQCFWEAESGGTLATLQARAIDYGADGVVINGNKILVNQGPTAARLLVLTGISTPQGHHRGPAMVVVDADSPGMTVRPVALASGRRELAEVSFDNVRVPAARVVGGIGNGGAVATYVMQYERAMYGYATLSKAFTQLSRLRNEMVEHGASPAHRERFARTYLAVLTASACCAQTIYKLAAGETVGPESSIAKRLFAAAERDVNDLILDVQRARILADITATDHNAVNTIRADWWYSRAAAVRGGSAEIQRGVIAERVLALPEECT